MEERKNPVAVLEPSKPTEKEAQKEYSLLIGLIGCFGGLLIQLVVGSMYQWGIINLYVTSYYRLTNDRSLTLESTAVAFPLLFIMIGTMMRLGIYLSSISHPLVVLITCKTLEAGAMFIASFMPNIWLFILFYGIMFGLCAGICFMIPMMECNKYLVGMKMIVNGIILIGTGSGAVVFGLFSYEYLNPTDIPHLKGYYLGLPELEDIALKVPVLLRWLSMLYLLVGYLGVAMIAPVCLRNRRRENEKNEAVKNPPQVTQNTSPEHANLPRTVQQAKEQPQLQLQVSKTQNDVPPKEPNLHISQISANQATLKQQTLNPLMPIAPTALSEMLKNPPVSPPTVNGAQSILTAIKSRVFWVSALAFLLGGTGCFMMNGNFKTYVKNEIKDDQFLTIVGVIGGIGNGCSRILWNYLFSKTGYKTTLLTIFGLAILVYSTIRFTVHHKVLYLLEIFIINCCLGGFLVSTPTSALCVYGPTTGANIYGILWDIFGFSNLLGYIFVSQLSKSIGFNNVIYVCLGMSILALPIVIFTKFQGPWENDTSQLEFLVNSQLEKQKENEQKALDKSDNKNNESSQQRENANQGVNDVTEQNFVNERNVPLYIELKIAKKENKERGEEVKGGSESVLNQQTENNKMKKIRLEPIKTKE